MGRILCVGTATEVGKTWVGVEVLTALRAAGVSVAARKPVQSFDPDDPSPTDADLLANATGEGVHDVCPAHRWYPMALAPPIAADLLAVPAFTMADLATETPPSEAEVVWLETVGGPLSPIAADADSADVARWFRPDLVLLVADARLGAINAVRLAAIPFAGRQLIVFLNRYADTGVCRTNRSWLTQHGFDVEIDVADLAARVSGGRP
jgi:dethiobiotin synthetase